MSAGWGHALASAVGGWQQGTKYAQDQKEREDEKKWRDEQRSAARQDLSDKQEEKRVLREAGRPVAMTEGAGGMGIPPTMDNRDAGQADNFKPMAQAVGNGVQQVAPPANGGLLTGGYQVAGQSFADRDAAQAELARHNAPEAVNRRVAQAYRGLGQHDKAMAMESSARTAELQTMQLADQRWKRDLGKAMRAGHEGLAQLATGSEAGPMAGLKVQAMVSPDGKSVTYAALDKDGKTNPIPGLPVFSNDQNGLIQAAWMLDQTIDPAARMAHYTAEKNREEDRSDKKETRVETQRHNMAMEGFTARGLDIRASAAGDGGKGKSTDAAPFDPLSDFDTKQAYKQALELAGKEAEASGKPYSEKRVQAIYGNLRDAAAADNTNRYVQQTVSKELRASASDPAQYAATYEKARQVANSQQLAAWGFRPPGSTAGPKPAQPATASAAPAAAQSAVAPVAAAPQAAQSPIDQAGTRLDAARTAFAELRRTPAPGLAAGRAAIDEHAARLQAARAAVAQAEAEYQRVVPQSGPAFVRPNI